MRTQIQTHLDTRACLQFAQAADERPAAGWDVGDFGDGLHPLGTSDAHLHMGKKLIHVITRGCLTLTEEQSGEVKSKAEGVCVCRIYLRYPQGTADVSPLGSCTCCLHGAALLRTQKALRVDAEDARPAQPVSNRHFDDAVTRLWGEGIGTVIINIIHLKLIARQTFI